MSLLNQTATDETLTSADAAIEECVDEIDDFVASLQRHSQVVLAIALRIHLSSLLQALMERGECTHSQVAAFVAELAREVLQPQDG
jgi:hypothetical protein